jgi:hypothetical protein
LKPFGGPAFEPLISKEARSLVPSRGRILFGVSPLPGPCCKRERKRKKGKGYEIERRCVPFLARLLRRRRSVARFSCQKRRLSRRGVNATGRVVGRGGRRACVSRSRNGSRARCLHAVRGGSLAAPGWDVSLADDVTAAPARLPPSLLPAHFRPH